jgi:hypothetical protein
MLGLFQKVILYDPVILLVGMYPKRNTHIQSSIFVNTWKAAGTTQISTNEWTDKQNVEYI